jgi:molybdate transport system substrate-binding protein
MFSFAGAVTNSATQPEAAVALLRFLASPEAAAAISKAGLQAAREPIAGKNG